MADYPPTDLPTFLQAMADHPRLAPGHREQAATLLAKVNEAADDLRGYARSCDYCFDVLRDIADELAPPS